MTHSPAVEADSAGHVPRLTRVRPGSGQFRFYQLGLWPDLFSGCALIREFGRIGQPGRIMKRSYPSEAEALAALRVLYAAKCRRGYQPDGGGVGAAGETGTPR